MRLPGTVEERLGLIRVERRRLLHALDVAALEDAGVHVECSLAGATSCIQLRLEPQDVQFLREGACADFALLLCRGDDVFEAHIVELKRTVGDKDWVHVQKQLEWGVVRLLAIAGVLGIRIDGVTVYTAFCHDKLARERSPNLVNMKIPVGPPDASASDASVRRWAEARLAWERGRIRMEVVGKEVEHRRLPANEAGRASVACRTRSLPGEHETRWVFEPAEH
ncbi:hypothetical protein BE21_28330 [Sorangium cellulosum]|uniref:Uncharacterized protein n=1 Tax=Sorangium cellulosum TaxID=56 RepID=A0A150TSL0_SORCE|nr:hypothetical protein BE21_28330 [Sorangium cellulosum]